MALHIPIGVAPNPKNPFGRDSMLNGYHLNLPGELTSDSHGPLYAYFGTTARPGYVIDHPHQGTDYPAPVGTPVLAMAPSVVLAHLGSQTFARGYYILTGWPTQVGGYVVLCEQHLSSFVAPVGAHVAAGAVTGKVGSSGQLTAPSTHIEVRFTTVKGADWHNWQQWRAVNPLRILPGGDLAANPAFLPVNPGVVRKVACSGGYLWSAPTAASTRKGALPAGELVTTVGQVAGGAWSFSCNGTPKSGTAWYEVSIAAGVALNPHQFAAIGRF